MEAVSGGEIRTDEPGALDVPVRLLLAGERESLVKIAHTCLILKRGFIETLRNVSNQAQHRIAWFCHSKIMGNMNRKAISEHPARASRETIPATGERT